MNEIIVEHKFQEDLNNNGGFITVKTKSFMHDGEEVYTITINGEHLRFTSSADLIKFKETINRAIFNILISK